MNVSIGMLAIGLQPSLPSQLVIAATLNASSLLSQHTPGRVHPGSGDHPDAR